MNSRLLLCALSIALFGCAGSPTRRPPEPTLLPELEARITVDRRATLLEWVDIARNLLGLTILIDGESIREKVDPTARRIALENARGESLLRWITRLYGLGYAIRDGAVVISTRDSVEPLLRRNYDIRPLQAPRDRVSPDTRVALPQDGFVGFSATFSEVSSSVVGEDLVAELIRTLVTPGEWEEDQTLELFPGGTLQITCQERHHRQIAELLRALVDLRAREATVEARFFTIPADRPFPTPGPLTPRALSEVQRALPREGVLALRLSVPFGVESEATLTDDTTIVSDVEGGKPIIGTFLSTVGILRALPFTAGPDGDITLDLEFAVGTTDLHDPPLKERLRKLKLPEGTLRQIKARLGVPRNGGALLEMPTSIGASDHRSLCLVTASAPPSAPRPRNRMLFTTESPPDSGFRKRFERAQVDRFKTDGLPLEDVLSALSAKTGISVFPVEESKRRPVTLDLKGLSLERILRLIARPLKLDVFVRDEAVYLHDRERDLGDWAVLLSDVRDIVFPAEDLVRPGKKEVIARFTGEDIASFILNTVHRNFWEEADGRSISYERGILHARNTPGILRDVQAFLSASRKDRRQRWWLSGAVVTLPAAEAERVLRGNPGDAPVLGDADHRSLLSSAKRIVRLSWPAVDSQRTHQVWETYRSTLADWEAEDDPVMDVTTLESWMEVRAVEEGDEGMISLDVDFREEFLRDVQRIPVNDGLVIESPRFERRSTTASRTVPIGKPAVFGSWRSPAPGEEEVTLLILRAQKIP